MKNKKEEILKFIKEFNDITVKGICQEKGIRSENIYKKSTTLENMLTVKKEIKRRIMLLVLNDSTTEEDI